MTLGGARYRRVLATPGVAPLYALTVLGRVPIGLVTIALVLFLREETGSFTVAGLAAAGYALGTGLVAPFLGRLIDRLGQRPVLLPLAVVHATSMACLVPLGHADVHPAVLVAVAWVTGATVPPLSSALRALWPTLLGEQRDELLPAALALDAIAIELIFVTGPLLVAAAAAVLVPEAALLFGAALTLAGTVAFVAQPASRATGPSVRTGDHGLLGAMAAPGVRAVVLCTVPAGFCFGATEVALPAFARAEGAPDAAGLLLAAWALTSAAGGFAYGARSWTSPVAQRWPLLLLGCGVTFLPLALAPSVAVMVPLAMVAGCCIAPAITAGNELVGRLAPSGVGTEAYTWVTMALVGGIAGGNAVAGALAEGPGWRAAVLTAAIVALAGGALATTRRRALVAAPSLSGAEAPR
ncbi:MFS transporter [Conexibacter sp. W3-3-2]|uniref:MFS transporter n=1 Tax=Conexibacter sp. W3-3-2 TaxID=2675227 RepID=UPI0012B74262|nr:MFS transporter [Conexibacter sp. W3-3-2]MTD43340.1 MFS transporter [Conexibacter sp. W3-3-2]